MYRDRCSCLCVCVPGQSRDERNRCQRAGEQKKTPEAVTKVGETPDNERPRDKRTEDASELGNRRLWRQPTAALAHIPPWLMGQGTLFEPLSNRCPVQQRAGQMVGREEVNGTKKTFRPELVHLFNCSTTSCLVLPTSKTINSPVSGVAPHRSSCT